MYEDGGDDGSNRFNRLNIFHWSGLARTCLQQSSTVKVTTSNNNIKTSTVQCKYEASRVISFREIEC